MSEVEESPSKGRVLFDEVLRAWPIFAVIFTLLGALIVLAGDAYVDGRALDVHNAQPGPQDISQLVKDVQTAIQTAESTEQGLQRVETKLDQLLLILTQRNLEGR